MKILIIRFRQIGDSVLALALCNSLRKSFPTAEIHLVLNKSIAPLFENHPSIDKIITFDKSENSKIAYVKKVWRTVRENNYDIIIDMRSTLKTSLFSLFSLRTHFRIGRKKWYTLFVHNYRIDYREQSNMIDRNLKLLSPLEEKYPIKYDPNFNLAIQEQEHEKVKEYLLRSGIDFSRPIMLVTVASKLSHKMWAVDRMSDVLQKIIDHYDVQIIMNYVPGHEENIARGIYGSLNRNSNVFININAGSLRELAALCSFCTFFFGNESGNRHIAHAMNIPSFSIFSPDIKKAIWLPQNQVEAVGISVEDLSSDGELEKLTYQQRYDLITVDIVWEQLNPMLEKYLKKV